MIFYRHQQCDILAQQGRPKQFDSRGPMASVRGIEREGSEAERGHPGDEYAAAVPEPFSYWTSLQ